MATVVREKKNWFIHLLFSRQEYDECLRVIEEQLKAANGLCEYPVYVKGLIRRQQGRIQESLQLFQAATCLNPHSAANLKQVGRSLFLLGKHKSAIDVYNEAEKLAPDDWELYHSKGLSFMYLKQYAEAAEAFNHSNSISKHDQTYLQLGKVYVLQGKLQEAVDTYLEALEYSPESAELLTTVGLLYLQMGENYKAFEYLGNSLTHDPKNAKTILAAGSIIQDHSDMDVALVKYRVAALQTPNSSQLWNNIGMCFFGKQKYVAAVACLKRALFLDPFEWIIAYNLGLVHLSTGQHASAFHYFSASINLKPDFASSYMYLGITLARLEDVDNACSAYDKALSLEKDQLFHLNYAATLLGAGQVERAREQFVEFEALYGALDEEARASDAEIVEQRVLLAQALEIPLSDDPATAAPGGRGATTDSGAARGGRR